MLIDVAPGQVLGRYELLMPIAKGGMAMVWAARLKGSRGFQKLVAIKTMLPVMSDDPNFEKMFLDEASLASEIRHPHVIEILDLGEQDNVLYLVMEWVDGEPLNVVMNYAAKEGGIPLRIAVSLVSQACRGLHAAHELRDERGDLVGLVHRDITPQNILVTYDGVVKLVDFGVAKATSRVAAETEAGQLKGKIAYMSPEQMQGKPIDRRTDVFAMGILLYMLTTGVHPFKGDDEPVTVQNIMSLRPAPPPRRLVRGMPEELEAVILQALAKDPVKRFPTANDLLKALTAVVQPGTDEEVAEYVRTLLRERKEKRRRAVSAALEVADRHERARELSPAVVPEMEPDEVATAVDRPSFPSPMEFDSGAMRPPISSVDSESLSGVGGARPSLFFESSFRRRSPIYFAAGVFTLAAAFGAFVALNESPQPEAVLQSAEPARPATRDTPEAQQPVGDVEGAEIPAAGESGASSAEADAATEPRRVPEPIVTKHVMAPRQATSQKPQPPPPKVERKSERPFVSPVRSPGF